MAPTTIDLDHIKSLSWTVHSSYNASNIITYNLALGASGTNLPLVFEGHPSFHALPTFGTLPVISAMGAVTRSFPEILPNFQSHNHVHGEHYLDVKRAFPVPKPGTEVQLETTAKIVEVVDRRSGVTVCVGILTKEAGGEEVCYNEWTSFIMKVPGKGASTKATDRGVMSRTYPSPTDRAPDNVVEYRTTPEQGALYRAASGDLNPLHIDPAVAKKGGFEGPILTGTCTLGMGVKHVLDSFAEGDPSRFGGVKVRLSKPVFPGETVRTEMWKENNGRRILYRQVVGDKIVMKDAAVELDVDRGMSRI